MTCIVGLVHENKVYIGADSCASNSYTWNDAGNHKIFTRGPYVIGCTTSFRMIDLLTYKLPMPKKVKKKNTDSYMHTTFIDDVRTLFKNEGFSSVTNSVENGGTFLVGFNDKLYSVQGDFAVFNCPNWGYSVGSGADAARGSLWTTRDYEDPVKKVHIALEAAEAVVPSVRGPFNIIVGE